LHAAALPDEARMATFIAFLFLNGKALTHSDARRYERSLQ
jgi:hypothetical protein